MNSNYHLIFAKQVEILKALAHPQRLEILFLVAEHKLDVTDIYSKLDLPQATVSQHLSVLRDRKVVKTEKRGKRIFYSLANRRVLRAAYLIREVVMTELGRDSVPAALLDNWQELLPLVHDPVCKTRVSPKLTEFHLKHKEQELYFCSSACMKKFAENH